MIQQGFKSIFSKSDEGRPSDENLFSFAQMLGGFEESVRR